jgi:hypothetical protein
MLVRQKGLLDTKRTEKQEQKREGTEEKTMKVPIATVEENKKLSPSVTGEPGTRHPPLDLGETRSEDRTGTAQNLVERVTALRGRGVARPLEPKSIHRRRTQADIYRKDAEIPYVKFEAAIRDVGCSLMERQDRMNEEIFCRINDLVYRVEDLEQDRQGAGGDT